MIGDTPTSPCYLLLWILLDEAPLMPVAMLDEVVRAGLGKNASNIRIAANTVALARLRYAGEQLPPDGGWMEESLKGDSLNLPKFDPSVHGEICLHAPRRGSKDRVGDYVMYAHYYADDGRYHATEPLRRRVPAIDVTIAASHFDYSDAQIVQAARAMIRAAAAHGKICSGIVEVAYESECMSGHAYSMWLNTAAPFARALEDVQWLDPATDPRNTIRRVGWQTIIGSRLMQRLCPQGAILEEFNKRCSVVREGAQYAERCHDGTAAFALTRRPTLLLENNAMSPTPGLDRDILGHAVWLRQRLQGKGMML